jgi:subfamily B ATP-binding cassette protein MsbA
MNWQLTLFVLLLLPASGYLISRIGKSQKNAAQKGQARLGELLSMFEETLTGLKIIKAFGAEKRSREKFGRTNNIFYRLMVGLFRKQYAASPISEFISAIVLVVILWFGGILVLEESSGMNGEFFILYLITFSQLIPPAKSFTEAYFKIEKGMASADRIEEIIKAANKQKDSPGACESIEFNSLVEFRNVSFRYDEVTVLQDINLRIEKGKSIALVGPSGGGKTTLVDLLPRFYDIAGGDLLIDGQSVYTFSIHKLRKLFGIVTQETILFNDTIENNIRFGNEDASMEAVINAAKVANAHDFITGFQNGYQTNIGDMGGKLSGGQRQRIAIARALVLRQARERRAADVLGAVVLAAQFDGVDSQPALPLVRLSPR